MSDIWYEQPRILFENKNYLKFFPTMEMNVVEKINALLRLSIYIGIALFFLTNKYSYLFIPVVIGMFTYLIFSTQKDKIETYFNSYNKYTGKDSSKCTKPTVNNPFMNINLITDKKTKSAACKPSTKIKADTEDYFGINLYRNVGDIFDKGNSQRQYYTMPSTTIPNQQTKFAKWLYGTGPTCKEKTINCATPWAPNK